MPQMRGAPHTGGRAKRILSSDEVLTTITTHMGPRGGVGQRQWKAYRCNACDHATKERSFCPTAAEFGVLNGFSVHAPWSMGVTCLCDGCTDRHGKRRCPASQTDGNGCPDGFR